MAFNLIDQNVGFGIQGRDLPTDDTGTAGVPPANPADHQVLMLYHHRCGRDARGPSGSVPAGIWNGKKPLALKWGIII